MVAEGDLNLKVIIEILKWEHSTCSLSWQKIKPYEIDARGFLSFARQDLEEDSDRAVVNALSNAKRAIACRIDELLTLLNLDCFSSRDRWTPWYKRQVLQNFGIRAPDILKDMITSKRNLLEHEYIRPARQELRNIVDIAELFLGSTDKYIEQGNIRSVRIIPNCVFNEDTLEILDKDLERRFGVGDKCELAFNSKTKTVKLALNLLFFDLDAKEKNAGSSIWTEKKKLVNTLSLPDCAIEDVRELMILLREKGE